MRTEQDTKTDKYKVLWFAIELNNKARFFSGMTQRSYVWLCQSSAALSQLDNKHKVKHLPDQTRE